MEFDGLGQGWQVSPYVIIEPGATFTLAVCVNPGRGFNRSWEMPFRKRARLSLENQVDEATYVDYQISYTLTAVPDDVAYCHARFRPDGLSRSQQHFCLYRWHILDPIRFEPDLRVTIQALGSRTHCDRQCLPLQYDIASVAYGYQQLPTATFPVPPDRDDLEVI